MSDLSRVEQLLKNILGEDVQEVAPQSRAERILRAIAGEPVVVDGRLNLIPVMTKDGDIGYRDRISGEFYAYSGSGTLQPYE